MIQFEMYLNGQLLDAVPPSLPDLRTNGAAYLKRLTAMFEKKYASRIVKSGSKPSFCLSGVPSAVNRFLPLSHPTSRVPSFPATTATAVVAADKRTIQQHNEKESIDHKLLAPVSYAVPIKRVA